MAIIKTERLANVAVAAAVVAIGAVPMWAGASLLHERFVYGRAATWASAKVVSAERLWLRELTSPFKRELWDVVYEFKTPHGAVVRSTGRYSQSRATSAPEPGKELRVVYRPEDPTSGYLEDTYRMFDAAWYVGLGLFIWFAAGAFAWWETRLSRREPPR